jgi:nucleoside-diphosphate-sugar epimerase
MRVTINGASGWLGHATLSALEKVSLATDANSLQVISSTKKIIEHKKFGKLTTNSLLDADFLAKTDLFVQLAFKTRDYISTMSDSRYWEENKKIISKSIKAIQKSTPKFVVLVSSGVVSQHLLRQDNQKGDPYTMLKLEEEKEIAEVCSSIGANLFVLRLWGASGEEMTEPLKYAIGNLIFQSLNNEIINITSSSLVYRRYADAAEQMQVCIESAISGMSEVIDSGGVIIEMEELADRIRNLLSPHKVVARSLTVGAIPDIYCSNSVRMEGLANGFGIKLSGIDEQILATKLAVLR